MDSTINVMDCCRTCLRVDCALTSTEIQDSDSIKFFDKLVACVSEVSWMKDSLPLICSPCIDRLRVAYDFLILCLESDQTLNRYVSKLEINLENHTLTTPPKFELALTSASTIQDSTLIKEEQQNSEYIHLKHGNEQELAKQEDLVDNVCDIERSSSPEENESKIEFIRETEFVKQNSVIQDTISDKQPSIFQEQSCQTQSHLQFQSQEHHSLQMQDASQGEQIDQQSHSEEIGTAHIHHNSELHPIVTNSLPNVHQPAANAADYIAVPLRPIIKRNIGVQVIPPTPKQAKGDENGSTEFTCNECGKSFKKKLYLKAHLRTHTGEKPFECKYCIKRFYHSSHLHEHIRRHTGEKPFQCAVCSKRFTFGRELNMHMKSHTEEKHACTCCDRRYLTSAELNVHMQEHTDQQPYKCIVCQKVCNYASELQSHMMTHTGEDFTCVTCDKKFTSAAYLAEHTCTYTGENLSTHTVCERQFTRLQYLEKHMQTNTGKKPYPCFVCGKKFTLSSCLNVHLRIHTGEKPYYCNTCDKKLTTSSDLTVHN